MHIISYPSLAVVNVLPFFTISRFKLGLSMFVSTFQHDNWPSNDETINLHLLAWSYLQGIMKFMPLECDYFIFQVKFHRRKSNILIVPSPQPSAMQKLSSISINFTVFLSNSYQFKLLVCSVMQSQKNILFSKYIINQLLVNEAIFSFYEL